MFVVTISFYHAVIERLFVYSLKIVETSKIFKHYGFVQECASIIQVVVVRRIFPLLYCFHKTVFHRVGVYVMHKVDEIFFIVNRLALERASEKASFAIVFFVVRLSIAVKTV